MMILLSTSFVQAHYRAYSKRPHPVPSVPFVSSQLQYMSDDSLIESSTKPPSINQANEEQLEQFRRLLFDRLNLKEVPNVRKDSHDGTRIPSIVKQIEKQQIQKNEEINLHQKQKIPEEIQATTERAILPGGPVSSFTCQRQLAVQLNINKESLHNFDCFRFAKSPNEARSLPTNQLIKQLRIYVKKNYFHFNHLPEQTYTADMFQVYLVFRPTFNDTTSKTTGPHFIETMRLPISAVKKLNRNWFELTIDPKSSPVTIQQIYSYFISPWYGLAINHVLQSSWPAFYRRYYSKKHLESLLYSNDEENENTESQQLPYMVVEYGEQISSARRGLRQTNQVFRKATPTCDSKSPCCRRSLTIDLDQISALDFVIYPRQIDIGVCIGVCGAGGSSLKLTDVKNAQHKNDPHAAHNMFLFYQNLTGINKPDQQTQCCSYSRTGGLEIMYSITNGGPIIRKYIPNMIVEQCRCGLPATINQLKTN